MNISTVEKLAEERGFKCRILQGALAELEEMASVEMPLYKDPDFLRCEILRVVREAREVIETERLARLAPPQGCEANR